MTTVIEPVSVRLKQAAQRHPDDRELVRMSYEVQMLEEDRDRLDTQRSGVIRSLSTFVAITLVLNVLATLLMRHFTH